MPVSEVQRLINAIDNNKTEFTYSPFISKELRKLVEIPEPEKKLSDELKRQTESMNNEFNELKQQMNNIQVLLNSFITNSNSNNSNGNN
jgi:predicted nucleic acid-binding protein